MKIALAQINTTVGALQENAQKILDFTERAKKAAASLAVFPELTITGYPPLDLLYMPHFVASQEKTLAEVAGKISGITAVVGYAEPNPSADGKGLFNTAAILKDGKVVSRHRKRLLIILGADDARDRTKNLFARDAHLVIDAGKDRRLQIETVILTVEDFTTPVQFGAFTLADGDIP